MLQPEMRSSIGRKAGEGMTQTHVPYGYRIEDGKALADEVAAEKLKSFFNEYLVCGSMLAAAKKVDIEKTHSMLGRMLKNRGYLGTDFYPRLIDDDTFQKAQELRGEVARKLGRIHEYKPKETKQEVLRFEVGKVKQKYQDPYRQAQYAYTQIREVQDEG